MSSGSHLTAKYRPQRFDQVAGQDQVKAILSRAAHEEKPAAAYLFSGTRGVGKTTMARILAKALNCREAPTPEPCNVCDHCRQITQGSCVDVIEIDAASNRGIEEARRLKEDVGYAPIDCRYKVFIIDEAHMLTREAFNALLKTLEEPPGRVCFVMATTEAHRFPPTIISRCQHYSFKRLTQPQLEAHLRHILDTEAVPHEDAAVALVARRGAGSVRDAMSLLAQVLALGAAKLEAADARAVLGLAGQEVFRDVVAAILDQDCPRLATILRDILDQGVDLGFFLRELVSAWRNMFLLRQAGDRAFPVLEMSEEDAQAWLEWARKFQLAHIHACWQMTVEGQRRVLKSLEPATALELLLFNLACLPRLLRIHDAAQGGADAGPPPASGPAGAPSGGAGGHHPQGNPGAPGNQGPPPAQGAAPEVQESAPEPEYADPKPEAPSAPEPALEAAPETPKGPASWESFKDWVQAAGKRVPGLIQAGGVFKDGVLTLTCCNEAHCNRIGEPAAKETLARLAREYFAADVEIAIACADTRQVKSKKQLKSEAEAHPSVSMLIDELGGRVIDVSPLQ